MSGADTDRRRFEALRHCLTASPDTAAPRDLAAWCRDWRARVESEPAPVAQAILGGFAADRVGWAFAAGYQAALRQLLAGVNEQPAADARLALCATESGGNRPRDIATVLRRDGDGWRLDGAKSWITLGEAATELLVVARLEDGGPRPALKVARVPAGAAGVTLENKAPLEFVPEIPHTAARFESVAVPGDGLLDGDGYDTVVKPFRTIEDTFIALAVQAWLLREARVRRWPARFAEALVTGLESLGALAARPAGDPVTHLALTGALTRAQGLYDDADGLWEEQGGDAAARWHRDRPLFRLAAKARLLRAQRAWERLNPDQEGK
ncbi:hypothetical protein Y5W_01744 [Alcanivorax sp. 521-1]|uniref:Acyl-CoA oxidase/dehydrogenase middle domain-containing protein n=1 Tax=Alloalcanivorax profundimaris TaxID=2735259 RepID=A0ABS0AQN5_9GAMM|nr:acyl-CoA dehydrogenase family protein [Alloalcanivorax profundimaris]MBF5056450.1 hypothetical protein [Alloalcanivorax profundimaris]